MFAAPCMTVATRTLKRARSATNAMSTANGMTHQANTANAASPWPGWQVDRQVPEGPDDPADETGGRKAQLAAQPRQQESPPADLLADDEDEDDQLDRADRAEAGRAVAGERPAGRRAAPLTANGMPSGDREGARRRASR